MDANTVVMVVDKGAYQVPLSGHTRALYMHTRLQVYDAPFSVDISPHSTNPFYSPSHFTSNIFLPSQSEVSASLSLSTDAEPPLLLLAAFRARAACRSLTFSTSTLVTGSSSSFPSYSSAACASSLAAKSLLGHRCARFQMQRECLTTVRGVVNAALVLGPLPLTSAPSTPPRPRSGAALLAGRVGGHRGRHRRHRAVRNRRRGLRGCPGGA